MNNNKVNIKDTNELYNEVNHLIEVKECFKNVGLVVMNHLTLDDYYKDYKVVFGAWSVPNQPNYYAKHCYLKNGKGEIIDLTAIELGVDLLEQQYIDLFEFTLTEYVDALHKADLETSLGYDMMIKMNEKTLEYFKKGIIIAG